MSQDQQTGCSSRLRPKMRRPRNRAPAAGRRTLLCVRNSPLSLGSLVTTSVCSGQPELNTTDQLERNLLSSRDWEVPNQGAG